jgi:hypothetical protein
MRSNLSVHDVPVTWTPEKILNELTCWGTTISLTDKETTQVPDYTIQNRLVLVYVSILQPRILDVHSLIYTSTLVRNANKVLLVVKNVPTDVHNTTLWNRNLPHEFLAKFNVISYKSIKTAHEDKLILSYFKKLEDMESAKKQPFNSIIMISVGIVTPIRRPINQERRMTFLESVFEKRSCSRQIMCYQR